MIFGFLTFGVLHQATFHSTGQDATLQREAPEMILLWLTAGRRNVILQNPRSMEGDRIRLPCQLLATRLKNAEVSLQSLYDGLPP